MSTTVAFNPQSIAGEIAPIFPRQPLIQAVARNMDEAIEHDGGSRRYGSAKLVELIMRAIREVDDNPDLKGEPRPTIMDLQLFIGVVLDCTDTLAVHPLMDRLKYQDQVIQGLKSELAARAA